MPSSLRTPESAPSAEQLACRLSLMAWEQGHRVSVLAPDENAARSLDELMWDYPAGRFLPHERAEAGQGDAVWAAPVSIVASADLVGADRQGLSVDVHLAHQGCTFQIDQASSWRSRAGQGKA